MVDDQRVAEGEPAKTIRSRRLFHVHRLTRSTVLKLQEKRCVAIQGASAISSKTIGTESLPNEPSRFRTLTHG